MFAEQRLEKIKEIMRKHKRVKIMTLSSKLGVSDVTVRKDLKKLEEEGFLKKTHGGAILVEQDEKEGESKLNIKNYEEKKYIAELAYNTVEKGDIVFLGSGSTCYLLAKKLRQLKDLTVVTNNINALNELNPYVKKVFLVGGELVYYNGMMHSSGEKDEYFKEIFVNKAFASVTGIDIMAGLTVNRSISTHIYKKIPKLSKNWTLLVDDSKFNQVGLYQVGLIDAPDCIITNKIDNDYKQAFVNNNIKIIT